MRFNSITRSLLAGTFIATSGIVATAGETPEAEVEQTIRQFYTHLNTGDFEKAFQFVKPGCEGFHPSGLLKRIPNEQVHAMIVAKYTAEHAEGNIRQVQPKHLSVRMLGTDHAIATYYPEGIQVEDGVSSHFMGRATLVMSKADDKWSLVHWHVSKLAEDEVLTPLAKR